MTDEVTKPSFGTLEIKTRRKSRRAVSREMILAETDAGTIKAGTLAFVDTFEVDTESFVKLYAAGVSALQGLTAAGLKVFTVMYRQVQANIGRGEIHLSYQLAKKIADNVSQKTYQRGMRELEEKGFIRKTSLPRMYQINPRFLFNGDRIAFVQTFTIAPARPKPPTLEMRANERDQFQIDQPNKENEK